MNYVADKNSSKLKYCETIFEKESACDTNDKRKEITDGINIIVFKLDIKPNLSKKSNGRVRRFYI